MILAVLCPMVCATAAAVGSPPLAPQTTRSLNEIAGAPRRFIHGHAARLRRNTAERFWALVQRGPGCWLWQGPLNNKGYGYCAWGGRSKVLAHRIAFELTNSTIDPAREVLHSCDTPPCARPDHLFQGTHQENMADAKSKGRMPRGSRNGMSILTEDQVLEIARHLANDEPVGKIAAAYRVSGSAISAIKAGTRWSSVTRIGVPIQS